MRPLVLLTGGTGTISVPTGDSPAVLDSAELYDPVEGNFTETTPMTAHRDRHAAVLLRDGRVLIIGGVDTVLVPMIVFPGPTMPSILSSSEFSIRRMEVSARRPRWRRRADVPTATLLVGARCWWQAGAMTARNYLMARTKKFVATGTMTESRYGQTATLLPDGAR